MMIQPIVEGHSEVASVPELVRRLLAEGEITGIRAGRPIRQHRSELTRRDSLTRAVRVALLEPECAAILILLDGDTDCPGQLGPMIQSWATAAAGGIPCAVVLAHREYEAWFLASLDSLRGRRGIRASATSLSDPETPLDAKGALEGWMEPGKAYHSTVDQPALTALFDMAHAYRRSRSFRRAVSAVGQLVSRAGIQVAAWPPANWGIP